MHSNFNPNVFFMPSVPSTKQVSSNPSTNINTPSNL